MTIPDWHLDKQGSALVIGLYRLYGVHLRDIVLHTVNPSLWHHRIQIAVHTKYTLAQPQPDIENDVDQQRQLRSAPSHRDPPDRNIPDMDRGEAGQRLATGREMRSSSFQ